MKNCRRLSGRKTGCTFTSLGKRPGIRTAGKGRLPEESGKHGISGGIFLASALAAWFSLLPGGQARAEEGIVVPAGTVIAGGGQTSNYDHFSWQMNQTLPSPDITFEGNSGGGVEAKGGWRSVFLLTMPVPREPKGPERERPMAFILRPAMRTFTAVSLQSLSMPIQKRTGMSSR